MKKLKPKFLALIFLLTATVFSCREDENPAPVEVAILAFSETIAENPTVGTPLGSLSATTNRGTLVYSLANQNPAGALAVDSLTGELSVANANLFDFEANPELTATGVASVEGVSQSAAITITLTDVKEGNTVGGVTVTAEDFSVTIDENPEAKQSLGTLKATTTEGTLSYALASQTPEGALSIDASTGELTVADITKFDYEVNKTITAQAVATAGAVSDTAIVTVTLKDVDEAIVAEAFSATIDEEPDANQVLGTLKASASMGTLTYAIVAGQADSAFAVNATSGELSVADPKAFDYETSPTVKATYEVSNGTDTQQGSITVTLNDIVEVEAGTIPFVTTWEVSFSVGRSITIPTDASYTYGYTVDWGDGSTSENQTGDATHTYGDGGSYTVKITGNFPAIRLYDFGNSNNGNKLTTIEQWGNIAWESFFDAFNGCRNLVYNATDAPDLSNVTSLQAAFANTIKFNGAIGNWDVSNIQNMEQMFYQATGFNQPLNNWDVSNVTNMKGMFSKASAFDQPLGAWSMRSIKNMDNTFDDAGLSHTNYGATLKGWIKQSDLPELIVVGAKGIKYCGEGTVYRNQLIDIKKWWFTNDAQDNNLCR
jgi:surface protein